MVTKIDEYIGLPDAVLSGRLWPLMISGVSEPGENIFEAVHPITELWTQAWDRVLDHPDGDRIVSALNQALLQSQLMVARKQLVASLS